MQHQCDLDGTFDLSVVTWNFEILSGPYLRNCKVLEVDSCMDHWLVDHLIQCRYAKSWCNL